MDYDMTCRICLNQGCSSKLISIFEYCCVDENNFVIAKLLEKCSNLAIFHDDNWPKYICDSCLDELSFVHIFQEKCHVSEEILRMQDRMSDEAIKVEYLCETEPELIADQDERIYEPVEIEVHIKKDEITIAEGPDEGMTSEEQLFRSPDEGVGYKCDSERCVSPESKSTEAGLLNHLFSHTHRLHMKKKRSDAQHIAYQREMVDKCVNDEPQVRDQIEKIQSKCIINAADDKVNKETATDNIKCPLETCAKVFSSMSLLREHQKVHDPKATVKCDYCDKVFASKAKREPHHRTHRGERPYACSVCPEARTTKSSLLKHLLCHVQLKCKPCRLSFDSSRSYVVHMKVHEHDPNYAPNIDVDELDANQLKLKRQIDEIRATTLSQKRNINTKCLVCYREFATPSELKTHAEVHQNVSDYLCNICGKVSITRAGYREHMFLHAPTGSLKCEYCDKVCSSNYQLKIHVRKHTGEKLYLCNICGKSFSTSNTLATHNLMHTGEKPFKCVISECTAAFRTATKLNRHRIVMHTTTRPYQCDVCTKKFAFSDEYKAHVATHSASANVYECGSCGKGFLKEGLLMAHIRVHTGEKPYKCAVCHKPFRLRQSLNSHMKGKHASNGPEEQNELN